MWRHLKPALSRHISELLDAGQYEQVAEILQAAEVEGTKAGDIIFAHMLAMIRQISLACDECRSEEVWLQQAYKTVILREHTLKQHLQSIIDLISEQDAAEPFQERVVPGTPRTDLPPPPPVLTPAPPQRPGSEFPPDLPVFAPGPPPQPRDQPSLSLVVYCLGPFRVYRNDQLITGWSSLRARNIFKYLIMYHGTPVAKDILIDILWPDAEPKAARRNLHQAIYSLRQTFRQQSNFQPILFENDRYVLNPAMDIWVDVVEFERHAQYGQRLIAENQIAPAMTEYSIAEGLYQGDFLEEDLYDDWPQGRREHLRNTYLEIADQLSRYYVQRSEYTAAIALCQKILMRDKCEERTHRRLIQCYMALGQRHLAVRQYQTCVEVLKVELDLEPSAETITLYRQILREM